MTGSSCRRPPRTPDNPIPPTAERTGVRPPDGLVLAQFRYSTLRILIRCSAFFSTHSSAPPEFLRARHGGGRGPLCNPEFSTAASERPAFRRSNHSITAVQVSASSIETGTHDRRVLNFFCTVVDALAEVADHFDDHGRCVAVLRSDRLAEARPMTRSLLEVHNGSSRHNPDSSRSEERRVGKECRSRWSPYH